MELTAIDTISIAPEDGKDGKDGKDGTSPYFADIDNEMLSVACDVNGNTKAAFDKTLNVKMWYGSTEQALTKLTTTTHNFINITTSTANKTIRIQIAKDQQIAAVTDITVTIACNGSGDQTLHIYLNGVRPGADGKDGKDAVIFDLVPSTSSIKKNKDNTLTPASPMTCNVLKIVGDAAPTDATSSDGTLKFRVDGDITSSNDGSPLDIKTGNVTYANTNKFIVFAFFNSDGTMLDKERVPIVYDGTDGKDGKDGKDGTDGNDGKDGEDGAQGKYEEIFYARSSSSTSYSGDYIDGGDQHGWYVTAPLPTTDYPFIWKRSRIYDPKTGTSTAWSYVRLTGLAGSQGQTGKWYEYAGIWGVDIDPQEGVTNTATLGKYVKYGDNFYMNVYTDGQANTQTPPGDSSHWSQMTGDREYYMAKAFFGDYAQFGSAIINGDWMISRHGKLNGADSVAYTRFDERFPLGNETYKVISTQVTVANTGDYGVITGMPDIPIVKGCAYTIQVAGRISSTTYSRSLNIKLYGVDASGNETALDNSNKSISSTTAKYFYSGGFSITSSMSDSYVKIRMKGYKYSSNGDYTFSAFITECTLTSVKSTLFIPNYALDMMTGKTYQNDAYISGTIEATNYLYHVVNLSDSGASISNSTDYVIAKTSDDDVTLPSAEYCAGKVLTVCNPIKRSNATDLTLSCSYSNIVPYFSNTSGTDTYGIGLDNVIKLWADGSRNEWRVIEEIQY